MNELDLSDALTGLDETLLDEAKADFDFRQKKKKQNKKLIITTAASFAVLLAGISVWRAGILFAPKTPGVFDSLTTQKQEIYQISPTKQNSVENMTPTAQNNGENMTSAVQSNGENATSAAKNESKSEISGYTAAPDHANLPVQWNEEETIVYKTVISQPDKNEEQVLYDIIPPKAGEYYNMIKETMQRHKGEDVYYHVVIDLYRYNEQGEMCEVTKREMEEESNRLFTYCQNNGYTDCTFGVMTYKTEHSENSHLYGDIVSEKLLENFPVSQSYGYLVRFENVSY